MKPKKVVQIDFAVEIKSDFLIYLKVHTASDYLFSSYASIEKDCPAAQVSEIEIHFLPGTAYKLTATMQLPFFHCAL
jgi:hypothetical protein